MTYNDTTTRVATIMRTLLRDDVELIDCFIDAKQQICVVVLHDDVEHMIIYDDT